MLRHAYAMPPRLRCLYYAMFDDAASPLLSPPLFRRHYFAPPIT